MLRSAEELRGYSLHAIDGEIGTIGDLYFDDSEWRIRYFVANTGNWLSGRRVLLSPLALTGAPESGVINLNLTVDEVRNSPHIDTAKPVSRQQEIDLHTHYGWIYYRFGNGPVPSSVPLGSGASLEGKPDHAGDPHLRSAKEVTGYGIRTSDGEFGHVEDFLIDDNTWAIQSMVVDTAPLWLGKKVLIAPRWIREVDWTERRVSLALFQQEVKNAPEWDGSLPVDEAPPKTRHRAAGR